MKQYGYEQHHVSQNGIEFWFVIDDRCEIMLHRVDGPAVIYPRGSVQWMLEGEQVVGFTEFTRQAGWTEDEIVAWKLTRTNTGRLNEHRK